MPRGFKFIKRSPECYVFPLKQKVLLYHDDGRLHTNGKPGDYLVIHADGTMEVLSYADLYEQYTQVGVVE
jgi:hypothetical protein